MVDAIYSYSMMGTTKNRLSLTAVVALGILLLTGCGHQVEHGLVINKEFSAATVRQEAVTNCRGPQASDCNTVMMPRNVPASWRLEIRNENGDTAWRSVDEATFDNAKVNETRI